MALSATCGTSGVIRLFCFIMTTLTVLMQGILYRRSIAILLGLVALFA